MLDAEREEFSKKFKHIMDMEHLTLVDVMKELAMSYQTINRVLVPEKHIVWSSKTIKKVKMFIRNHEGNK